jgi:heme exporter protein B
MRAAFFAQYWLILKQGFAAELSDKERLLSPVLFAMTLLLLFSFAMGNLDESLRTRIYTAQSFLTAFFALQLSFSRLFEPEQRDSVFDLMRTYPISHAAWFLAKYTLLLILGGLILVPTMVFGAFLQQTVRTPLLHLPVFGVAFLALAGLAALGLLLSVMTLKANGRQILYPLLYFPLTTPVLLAAVQASLLYMDHAALDAIQQTTAQSWLGLLAAFDVIYFTLGLLLYSELVDDT